MTVMSVRPASARRRASTEGQSPTESIPGLGTVGDRIAKRDNGTNAPGCRDIEAAKKVPSRRPCRFSPYWGTGIVSPGRHVGGPVRLLVPSRRTGRYGQVQIDRQVFPSLGHERDGIAEGARACRNPDGPLTSEGNDA